MFYPNTQYIVTNYYNVHTLYMYLENDTTLCSSLVF
jgi:hypothetical protein